MNPLTRNRADNEDDDDEEEEENIGNSTGGVDTETSQQFLHQRLLDVTLVVTHYFRDVCAKESSYTTLCNVKNVYLEYICWYSTLTASVELVEMYCYFVIIFLYYTCICVCFHALVLLIAIWVNKLN